MNPQERASHPSRAQIDELLAFLEKNTDLAKGFSKVPSARDAARTKWESETIRLNSLGGSSKSWKQWTKYWADKKSAVKKKAALRAAVRRRTGGGAAEVVELTEVEERILCLMGGEGFAEGDRHLSIDPFGSLPSSTLVLPSTEVQPAPSNDIIVDIPHTETEPVSIPGTSIASNRSNILPSPEAPIQNEAIETFIQQHSQPQPVEQPSPNHLQSPRRNTTPRRRRRFQNSRGSPPSQRRSQLISLTERFLRVEERRLELENRTVAVNENLARVLTEFLQQHNNTNFEIAQGLQSIGRGLILLSEILKK